MQLTLLGNTYRLVACGIVFIFIALLAQAQTSATTGEHELFLSVNRARSAQSLPPLKWNEDLALAARKHAAIMAQHGAAQHGFPGEPALATRVTQAGVKFSWVSENVCAGAGTVAIETQFSKSPNHLANILDTDMDSVGIGVVERNGQSFAVEDFSKVK
jgi:uncharacterized protein YkwD